MMREILSFWQKVCAKQKTEGLSQPLRFFVSERIRIMSGEKQVLASNCKNMP
ncbi:MAG: hypothetical protein IKP82_03475 [Oscillospiraceae bacterium]|nr:hypothetical protein [Oscillospiraceae bacterium]